MVSNTIQVSVMNSSNELVINLPSILQTLYPPKVKNYAIPIDLMEAVVIL